MISQAKSDFDFITFPESILAVLILSDIFKYQKYKNILLEIISVGCSWYDRILVIYFLTWDKQAQRKEDTIIH